MDEYYLKEAPIRKSIFKLAVPMMIGLSIGAVYNVINAYFIGLLHNTAMFSAITFGLPIFVVLMAIGNVFGAGGGTYITRLLGEGNKEKASNIAGYSFYASIFYGILISIIALIFINPLTGLLGANVDTFRYTKEYITYLLIGGFVIVLNFTLEQIVRAKGATKQSMIGVAISCGFSLILDPLFILYFKLNVKGAAIATILANLSAVIYYVYYLEAQKDYISGFIKKFKISFSDKIEIYKVGIGELFQATFLVVVTLLLNNYAIEYGDNVVTAFGIALRITQIPEFLAMGIFLGLMPLFSYTFSSKNKERFNKSFKFSLIFITIIIFVFSGLVFLFRLSILNGFSNSSSVLAIGTYILVVMVIASIFNSFTGMFISIFQATGQGMETIIISILQSVGYIIALYVLHMYFGLHGVIWSMAVTEIVMFIFAFLLFMRFKFKFNRNCL